MWERRKEGREEGRGGGRDSWNCGEEARMCVLLVPRMGIDGEDCSGRGTCNVCECLCDDDLTDNGDPDQVDERLSRPGVCEPLHPIVSCSLITPHSSLLTPHTSYHPLLI